MDKTQELHENFSYQAMVPGFGAEGIDKRDNSEEDDGKTDPDDSSTTRTTLGEPGAGRKGGGEEGWGETGEIWGKKTTLEVTGFLRPPEVNGRKKSDIS